MAKFQLPRISFKMSDRQKNILAISLTLIVVIAAYIGYNWFTNPSFRDNILGNNLLQNNQNSDESLVFRNLESNFPRINPEQFIYQDIALIDLPIYPKAWVERNFSSNEINNELISGPGADADSDGLSNKQEYIYGSNPKNPNTLCSAQIDQNQCQNFNDKQNVERKISPLTGLELDIPQTYRVKRQDYSVLNKIQDSFETAAREGVDFPTLYQLSQSIDLSGEIESVKVNEVSSNRQSAYSYSQFRAEVLQNLSNNSELISFNEIYQLSNKDDLRKLEDTYASELNKIKSASVPSTYVKSHKAYTLVFEKLIKLVQHRRSGVEANQVTTVDFKETSRKIATEVMWSYRQLNSELSKLPTGDPNLQ